MHHVKITHLGPIQSCEIDIDDFTVLTGPQASGKSTIAKTIYFFRTIKDDILDSILKPVKRENEVHKSSHEHLLKKHLRNKFLRIFGSTWAMPMDMSIEYTYSQDISVRVFLREGYSIDDIFDDNKYKVKNIVDFIFSNSLQFYLKSLDHRNLNDISIEQKKAIEDELADLFNDKYETVFIPAGRSMITLLTDQLNYIFTSMDDSQRRALDYCTQMYVEMILRMKPLFTGGLKGFMLKKHQYNSDITGDEIDTSGIEKFINLMNRILKGRYVYADGEERLVISQDQYVKINYASSGQQEAVWVFNILFYYLIEKKPIHLILEEPEAHLYPESQKYMSELLALFVHSGNLLTVTTHSPYILAEFNNLLYANEVPDERQDRLPSIIDIDKMLPYKNTIAYYVTGGGVEDGMESHPGLIANELIDGASGDINQETDRIMELIWDEENDNAY